MMSTGLYNARTRAAGPAAGELTVAPPDRLSRNGGGDAACFARTRDVLHSPVLGTLGFRRWVLGDGYVGARSLPKRGVRLQGLHEGTGGYFLRHRDVRKIVPCQPRAQPEYNKKEQGNEV